MNNQSSSHSLAQLIPALCRGDHALLSEWLTLSPGKMLIRTVPCVVVGCALYGFSMGLWRGAEMGIYVAIKLPLLIFCTLLVNGLINGLLAAVLDSGITMRQSLQFLLTGFATMSIILGALSPISLVLALHAPAPDADNARDYHAFILLFHTAVVAYAGILSHHTLRRFLLHFSKKKSASDSTFFAWIGGNLFVGAQLSWILRPFFGSPQLEVAFLRDDPFTGTFYETVWNSILYFF
jgi:hypothetical protein